MSKNATWWDNPGDGTDSPVVRHATDPNAYQYPDQRMLEKMPAGRVGAFAIVPAARKDGTSRGFDADLAGVVHVDPDAPDGGAIVDLTQVSKGEVNQAMATSAYPHQVYYKLGAPAKLVKPAIQQQPQFAERVNPILPGSFVVPKAANDGTQTLNPITYGMDTTSLSSNPQGQPMELGAPPPLAMPVTGPAPQQAPQQQPQIMQPQNPQMYPQPQPQPYPYAYPQMAPPPPDPAMQQMIAQLAGQMQGLVAVVQGLQNDRKVPQQPTLTQPTRRAPKLTTTPEGFGEQNLTTQYHEQRRRKQAEVLDDDMDEEEDDKRVFEDVPPTKSMVRASAKVREEAPRQGVITGFEALEIPFIEGPNPVKPSTQCIFEYPGLGKQAAFFHQVIVAETCVTLVYDTRFEGSQYLPPELGEQQITLHVTQKGAKKQEYNVTSMGLAFSCGVLDMIVLVRVVESTDINVE